MSLQPTLFGKVASSRKVYGKPTNNCEQFVNACVADESRCSPSLPLQQAKKLVDAAWKAADHGKDKVVVSHVLSSSTNDGECMMKSFVVPVPEFPLDTKFPSDVLSLKSIAFEATNSSILASGKSAICVRMGGGLHLCERHYV